MGFRTETLRRKMAGEDHLAVKKQRKSAKVLSTKKSLSSDAQATLSANATQSPLLLLPTEIRTRIYAYVLGNKIIHVMDTIPSDQRKRLNFEICRVEHPRAMASSIVEAESEVVGGSEWREKHHRCHRFNLLRSTRLRLGLLQVCRQIHSEAALLPFATNTFILDNIKTLSKITTAFIAEQRKAITSIALVEPYMGGSGFGRVPLEVLDKLSGLRHLIILANVPYDPRIKRSGRPRRPLVSISQMLRGTVQTLKYVEWQTAKVCVTTSVHHTPPGWNPYSGDLVRGACRLAEQDLLQAWDADVQRGLEQDRKRATRERHKKWIRTDKKMDREDRAETRRRNLAAWQAQQRAKAEQLEAKRAKRGEREAGRIKAGAQKPKGKKVSKPNAKRVAAKAEPSESARTRLGLRKVKRVSYAE